MRLIGIPVEILLVEDNAGDVGLIEEVFEEAKIRNKLQLLKTVKKQCSIYVVKGSS